MKAFISCFVLAFAGLSLIYILYSQDPRSTDTLLEPVKAVVTTMETGFKHYKALPEGWKMEFNGTDRYRWVDSAGYQDCFSYDTVQECIDAANEQLDFLNKKAKDDWREVK